METVSVKG